MDDQSHLQSGSAIFDPVLFLKRPQTILRVLALVFSIVVFASIAAGCLDENSICIIGFQLNGETSGACSYGTWIGVMAFLEVLLYLCLDTNLVPVSSATFRRNIVLFDAGFSCLWAFLWFVGFCYLTDRWRVTNAIVTTYETSHAGASITFSFFSIFVWGGICFLAYKKLQQGLDETDPGADSAPYASFPTPVDSSQAGNMYPNVGSSY